MELIEITEKGTSKKPIADLADMVKEIMSSTAELYVKVGYVPPWTGYLAFEGKKCVGTCAFKAPAKDNCVEIAYFTFPEYEGKGVATYMAQTLVGIALETVSEIKIIDRPFLKKTHQLQYLRSLIFSSLGNGNILKMVKSGNGS